MICPSPLTEPMEPQMLTALEIYLSTAPLTEVLTYVGLGILAVGLGPFAPAFIIQHVAAVRGAR